MGWTIWVFRCDDGDWRRVSLAWYDRFLNGDDTISAREGSVLRFAQVALKLEHREPVGLGQVWFVLHGVAEGGKVDRTREDENMSDAMELAFSGVFVSQAQDGGRGFGHPRGAAFSGT